MLYSRQRSLRVAIMFNSAVEQRFALNLDILFGCLTDPQPPTRKH